MSEHEDQIRAAGLPLLHLDDSLRDRFAKLRQHYGHLSNTYEENSDYADHDHPLAEHHREHGVPHFSWRTLADADTDAKAAVATHFSKVISRAGDAAGHHVGWPTVSIEHPGGDRDLHKGDLGQYYNGDITVDHKLAHDPEEGGKPDPQWTSNSGAETQLRHVAAHEFGHFLDDRKFGRKYDRPADSEGRAAMLHEISRHIPGASPFHGEGHGADPEDWLHENREHVINHIGTYAASHPHELVAELYAEHHHSPNPSAAARVVGRHLLGGSEHDDEAAERRTAAAAARGAGAEAAYSGRGAGHREGRGAAGAPAALIPEAGALLRAASRDGDLGFHVTASWADVQRKAKRIRAEGGVTIVVASHDGIGGQVKGDQHTYEAILVFRPGTRKVADWTCGCAWAAYAFDRSPAFKRFEGRKCSHALALQFEAQSQGMFGKEIHESEPPRKVPTVVRYDPDNGSSVYARPYEGSLAAVAVARLRAEEADPGEVIGQLIQTGMRHTAARDLWKSAGSLGPQDCEYCDQPATKALMWAEHMGYIPVCDAHQQHATDHLEGQGDEVEAVKDLPQKTASRQAAYFHNTFRELQPGDELKPASELGLHDRWHDDPHYSPNHVYMWHSDAHQHPEMHDEFREAFGDHTYEVQPEGHTEADPERDSAREWERAHGTPDDEPLMSDFTYRAPRARVVRKVEGLSAQAHSEEEHRCPHCGGFIGPMAVEHGKCPHCGAPLGGGHHHEEHEGHHAGARQTGLDLVDADQLGPVLAVAEDGPLYHGTTAEGLTHVLPSAQHGGHVLYPGAADNGHAYATSDPDEAWNYAKTSYHNTDHGIPRVYEVAPLHGDHSHVEPDPNFNDTTSFRSPHGFHVMRELPMPERMKSSGNWEEQRGEYPSWEHLGAKQEEPPGPKVSGIALKAHDTGRVLMLQRGQEEGDPASGRWEWPGGHHEDGDLTSLHAGLREWQEEVGQEFPAHGAVKHTWASPDGVYQGHVVVIPSEKDLSMKDGRVVPNPDDPKGDNHEQAAWWEIEHAKKNPALRDEVKAHTPWKEIARASLDAAKTASSWDPISNTTVSQPGRNLSEPEHSPTKNPASTGFAASEDPGNWDNLDASPTSLTTNMSFDATLHEQPEPALPSTDGGAEYHPEFSQEDLDPVPDDPAQPDPYQSQPGIVMDEDGTATPNTYHSSLGQRPVEEIVAEFQKSAAGQALMVARSQDSDDIAAAAKAHLSKTALAEFSPEEQRELINENPDARARNFADLRLEGSHYHLLEEAMANGEVDPSGLFI